MQTRSQTESKRINLLQQLREIQFYEPKFWIIFNFYRYYGNRENYPDNDYDLIHNFNDVMHNCTSIKIIYDKVSGIFVTKFYYGEIIYGGTARNNEKLQEFLSFHNVNDVIKYINEIYRQFIDIKQTKNTFIHSHYHTTCWDRIIEINKYSTCTTFIPELSAKSQFNNHQTTIEILNNLLIDKLLGQKIPRNITGKIIEIHRGSTIINI